MYLLKYLSWLITLIILISGFGHAGEDTWIILIALLIIDIPSTILIKIDIKKGEEFGNFFKDVYGLIKGEIIGFLVGKADDSVGARGYLNAANTSMEKRKEAETEGPLLGLGTRIFFNHAWTFLVFYLSWKAINKWW